ncbi:MAG: RNA polymerase sporulation sigma factor SigH [Candidatus Calescibacterium sp.]|nr:RNA polymerase sporulation sigma factor SigH [Candidatus Calescibacterium sp.]MDW8132858.1 RNA polymerase sporulation sigma factor SigH [Candidatus Calescibacterium sp.]
MLLLEKGKENNMKGRNLKKEKPQKVSSIFDEIVGQTSDESENIKDLKDNELVILAKKGNKKAIAILINKYKNFVRARSKFYFIIGADKEDIVQEGLIGLYKAIRDYNPDKKTSFRAFAELCIMRQIITAIKTATRQKHTPLNSYISLNKPIFEENGERVLSDVIVSTRNVNPEEIYITLELTKDIKEKMKKYLSSLEAKVLSEYLRGLSYHEVAKSIGKHIKSVDNALQRIKRKIQQTIKESYGD